jgi:hypothetical protein
VFFNYVDPDFPEMRWATRVQDVNGNYIEINYSGAGGRISTILDTLGNTYSYYRAKNGTPTPSTRSEQRHQS